MCDSIFISFSLAATGFAEENSTNVSEERLTPEDLDYLVNEVGNTQEESEIYLLKFQDD
ncbi:hypothetical protein [Peribacillus sp. NPDC058075]|uniref:hypothetical protein n=1 Tax=unclassified Peribacillus TaxID=2675266 RepID=UPI0036D81343